VYWDHFAVTGKDKVVPVLFFLNEHHAMKACWGSGSIAPCIPDLGTRWRRVVSFTARHLYPQGKNPWYPLYRRLGGPQSRSVRGGEEKNSQHLPGLEPPIIQPVAQRSTTELSRYLSLERQDLGSEATFCFIFNSDSYPMGTGGSFLGVKRPGREADHSPPSSVEVKNAWRYISTPHIRLHDMVLS
jgi:hypothetical protein